MEDVTYHVCIGFQCHLHSSIDNHQSFFHSPLTTLSHQKSIWRCAEDIASIDGKKESCICLYKYQLKKIVGNTLEEIAVICPALQSVSDPNDGIKIVIFDRPCKGMYVFLYILQSWIARTILYICISCTLRVCGQYRRRRWSSRWRHGWCRCWTTGHHIFCKVVDQMVDTGWIAKSTYFATDFGRRFHLAGTSPPTFPVVQVGFFPLG